jgi:hypothetical protein
MLHVEMDKELQDKVQDKCGTCVMLRVGISGILDTLHMIFEKKSINK